MLEVVQVFVMRWRIKFNSRKNKIMVVGKREGEKSWKIGEEIMRRQKNCTWMSGLIGNYEVVSTQRKW